MKCPNCGAEAKSKYCEYCGSEMPQEKPTVIITNNYYSAPPQQPTNMGAPSYTNGIPSSNSSAVHVQKKQPRKTWLWVLGWIFIFPLPLTILLLRKKDMKPVLKYGIIILAWLVFLAIGLSGNEDADTQQSNISSRRESILEGHHVSISSNKEEMREIQLTYYIDDYSNI